MSMNGPGMWMPKRKGGINWIATIEIEENGERFTVTRKARVRAGLQDKLQAIRDIERTNEGAARGFKVINVDIRKAQTEESRR